MPDRQPPPRESGRVMREQGLRAETIADLLATVGEQNAAEPAEPLHAEPRNRQTRSSRVRRLADLVMRLELEIICPTVPPIQRGLCLEIGALALRILEQGD